MITQSLVIKTKRIGEFKIFIKNLPTFRFSYNPLIMIGGDTQSITFVSSVDDANKLSVLFEKWHYEDNKKPKQKTFIEKLIGYFKNIF